MTRVVLAGVLAHLLPLASVVIAQEAGTPPGSDRNTQVTDHISRGQASYERQCAACHAANLRGNSSGVPPLAGEDFQARWDGADVWGFANYTDTFMPPSDPGRLTDKEIAEVIAFILQENDYHVYDDLLNLDLGSRSEPLRIQKLEEQK